MRAIQKYPHPFNQAGAALNSIAILQNNNHISNFNNPPPHVRNNNDTAMRLSMNSINQFGAGFIPSYNKGVSQSSIYVGGIIQSQISDSAGSSNYFIGNSLPQTVVRIRGKNNQTVETRGSLVMTMEEEKRAVERRRQIRRSNERLHLLENMEKERQHKLEIEIIRI